MLRARRRRLETAYGVASEELISSPSYMKRLCSWLLPNRDEFISELFSSPFELGFQGFLAVDVPCCPNGLVVFDLTLHDCVKHNRNLAGGGGCGSRWPDFALQAAQIISHRCEAVMQGVRGESKEAPRSIVHLSHPSPQNLSAADVVVRTE